MKIKLKDIWKMLKQSGSAFVDDNVMKMSAALAYYTLFALAPMMVVVISIVQFFYGADAVQGNVYPQIAGIVGPEAGLQIQQMIQNAAVSGSGTFSTIVSVVMLIILATGVFVEIQDSINSIWCLKAKPQKGFLKLIVDRVISFSMVISLGFIMLVALMVNTVVESLSSRLESLFPDAMVYVVYGVNLLLTFLITTFLFAIIFKVLPDAKVEWKTVWGGAIATSILFMLGKFGITLYINSSDVGSTYGAAGSIIILLLWVYYSSLILYFGAIFTKVYAQYTNHNIYPSKYAVFVKHVEVENKASLQAQESTKKVQEEKREE
jgi:membrane protein